MHGIIWAANRGMSAVQMTFKELVARIQSDATPAVEKEALFKQFLEWFRKTLYSIHKGDVEQYVDTLTMLYYDALKQLIRPASGEQRAKYFAIIREDMNDFLRPYGFEVRRPKDYLEIEEAEGRAELPGAAAAADAAPPVNRVRALREKYPTRKNYYNALQKARNEHRLPPNLVPDPEVVWPAQRRIEEFFPVPAARPPKRARLELPPGRENGLGGGARRRGVTRRRRHR